MATTTEKPMSRLSLEFADGTTEVALLTNEEVRRIEKEFDRWRSRGEPTECNYEYNGETKTISFNNLERTHIRRDLAKPKKARKEVCHFDRNPMSKLSLGYAGGTTEVALLTNEEVRRFEMDFASYQRRREPSEFTYEFDGETKTISFKDVVSTSRKLVRGSKAKIATVIG